MKQQRELRISPRYPGQTLILEVEGEIHPLIDISIGGLSFEGRRFRSGDLLGVGLSSALDPRESIRTLGRVANIRNERVGVAFLTPNFELFRYVIRHIGNVTDTAPYIMKECRR